MACTWCSGTNTPPIYTQFIFCSKLQLRTAVQPEESDRKPHPIFMSLAAFRSQALLRPVHVAFYSVAVIAQHWLRRRNREGFGSYSSPLPPPPPKVRQAVMFSLFRVNGSVRYSQSVGEQEQTEGDAQTTRDKYTTRSGQLYLFLNAYEQRL